MRPCVSMGRVAIERLWTRHKWLKSGVMQVVSFYLQFSVDNQWLILVWRRPHLDRMVCFGLDPSGAAFALRVDVPSIAALTKVSTSQFLLRIALFAGIMPDYCADSEFFRWVNGFVTGHFDSGASGSGRQWLTPSIISPSRYSENQPSISCQPDSALPLNVQTSANESGNRSLIGIHRF